MDQASRTAFYKQTKGFFIKTLVIVSSLVSLCTSTPIPPQVQEHPRVHYERLVRDTRLLHSTHGEVYTDFRHIRHDDPTIRVDDFTIQGIPSVDNLPTASTRFTMQEEELLPIHYKNIKAFVEILSLAIQDENTLGMSGAENFDERLRKVHLYTERVGSKLRGTMQRLDIDLDYNLTPSVNFTINQNRTYLNMRILFVLQELSEYMVPVLQDFVNYKANHTASLS